MTAAPPRLNAPPPSAGDWFSVADLLQELGDVDASRVRMTPRPGTATFDDLILANEKRTAAICEWVDGTLVEKAMGFHEATVAAILLGEFYQYLGKNDIGMLAGPDGVMKILPGIGRAPDVTFIRWEKLPGGRPPARSDKVPAIVPSLAVEVLSESNRLKEVEKKRGEYLRAGVDLVWEIDPETRSALAHRTGAEPVAIPPNGTLSAGDVMPGFSLNLRDIFDRADRRR